MSTLATSDAEVLKLRARLQAGTWRHVVILTGAGISVASGLPTYRGPGGLWTRPGVEVPDVTLFGEPLPVDAEWAAKKALRECDLFLAIGTSGTVAPAANFVRGAKYAGAWTLLVNLTPMQPRHPDFDVEVLGPAERLLPQLLGSA